MDRNFLKQVASTVRESLVVGPDKIDRKIFLGGARPGTARGVRDTVARELRRLSTPRYYSRTRRYYYQNYDIYYPETLFDGLMSGPNRYDLLTLENQLAEAVDAVVLVVESPGTLAELGAFANHVALRKKLVAVLDKRFERARSFIRQGPIRLLQDYNVGKAVYADFDRIEDAIPEIHKAVGIVAQANPVRFDISNVLHCHHFVSPCLFLLEVLGRDEITFLVSEGTQCGEERAPIVATTAVSILLREGLAAAAPGGIGLTSEGVREFLRRGGILNKTALYNRRALDLLRIEVLNRKRRVRPAHQGSSSWERSP